MPVQHTPDIYNIYGFMDDKSPRPAMLLPIYAKKSLLDSRLGSALGPRDLFFAEEGLDGEIERFKSAEKLIRNDELLFVRAPTSNLSFVVGSNCCHGMILENGNFFFGNSLESFYKSAIGRHGRDLLLESPIFGLIACEWLRKRGQASSDLEELFALRALYCLKRIDVGVMKRWARERRFSAEMSVRIPDLVTSVVEKSFHFGDADFDEVDFPRESKVAIFSDACPNIFTGVQAISGRTFLLRRIEPDSASFIDTVREFGYVFCVSYSYVKGVHYRRNVEYAARNSKVGLFIQDTDYNYRRRHSLELGCKFVKPLSEGVKISQESISDSILECM